VHEVRSKWLTAWLADPPPLMLLTALTALTANGRSPSGSR
jgi:hypothetical protein